MAVKDLVRKTDKIYKVKSRNSTVEYTIKKLEPGGKYHVIVQLGNMSKESSMKINTGEGHSTHPEAAEMFLQLLVPSHRQSPILGGLQGEVVTPQNNSSEKEAFQVISNVFLLINGDGKGTSVAVHTSQPYQ